MSKITTIWTYQLNNVQTEFAVNFDYLSRKFVQVTLIGKDRKVLRMNVDYRFIGAKTIKTTKAWGSNDGYQYLEIRRVTSATDPIVDFSDGSILRAGDLTIANLQSMHIAEEARNLAGDALGVNDDGQLDARARRIVNLGDPIGRKDAVNKAYVDDAAEGVIDSRNKALQYRNEAQGFRNEAEAFKNQAEAARNRAISAETNASNSANQAQTSATKAGQMASQAQASANDAKSSQSKAKESEKNSLANSAAAKLAATEAKQNADKINTDKFMLKGNAQNTTEWNFEYTLNRIGEYRGNVIQSVAIDDTNRIIYSLHQGRDGNDMYLNRFEYGNRGSTLTADSVVSCGNAVGHQGLAIQKQTDGTTVLWASAGYARTARGRSVVRFKYSESGSVPNYEEFILFDSSFAEGGSTTPAVSYDNRFLVARGYVDVPDEIGYSVVRVFDLTKMQDAGDYSTKHIYEFRVDELTRQKEFPLQGMACDGTFIYIQLGAASTVHDKVILIYTLDGRLVYKNTQVTAGKEQALADGAGGHWESEGVVLARNNKDELSLYILIVSGDSGKRISRLYSNNKLNMQLSSHTEKEPALFLNATHDIGIPKGHSLTLTEFDKAQEPPLQIFSVKNNELRLKNADSAFVVKITKNETRHIMEIRANNDTMRGGGINMYGANDSLNSGRIFLHTGGQYNKSFKFNGMDTSFTVDSNGTGSIGTPDNYFKDSYIRNYNTTDKGIITFNEEVYGEFRPFAYLQKNRLTLVEGSREVRFMQHNENGRNYFEFRMNKYVADGGGFNTYGAGDTGEGEFLIYTGGAGSKTFAINSKKMTIDFARDGEGDLGNAKNRFAQVFAVNGSIQTSDERLKTEIRDLPEDVLDAWESVSFITFRWKDMVQAKGVNARKHIGILAQEIDRAFKAKGLNAFEYGLLCYDEWDKSDEVLDVDGSVLVEAVEAGNRYGIRAEQCLFLEAECNRRKMKQMEERLKLLEEKLNAKH